MYVFFFVLVDRQKQEVVTQTAKRWDTGKKRPSPLTSHNNKPIPTPQKVKTAMQAPPIWRSDDGVENENRI